MAAGNQDNQSERPNPQSGSGDDSSTGKKNSARNSQQWAELEIVFLSFVALLFELGCMRWFSTEIRAMAFFRNITMIAFLLGLGAGFGQGDDRAFKFLPVTFLFCFFTVKFVEFMQFAAWRSTSQGSFSWQILANGNEGLSIFVFQETVYCALLLLGPIAASFCIGTRLCTLFNTIKGLKAYTLNSFGSLLGCMGAMFLTSLSLSPVIGMAVPALISSLSVVLKPFSSAIRLIAAFCMLGVFALGGLNFSYAKFAFPPNLSTHSIGATETIWSPYQRIDLDSIGDSVSSSGATGTTGGRHLGYVVRLNRVVDQVFLDPYIEIDSLPGDLTKIFADRRRLDAMGSLFGTSSNVLVLGAGLGQDIYGAVKQNAKQIDLVEIDPQLSKMSSQLNKQFEKDVKLRFVCDDARHFIESSDKTYDLVLFSNLYSQSALDLGVDNRLESYVYTVQTFKQAMKRLAPGGRLVVTLPVIYPWIGERIFKAIELGTGRSPHVFQQSYRMASKIPTIYVVTKDPLVDIVAPANWAEIGVSPKSSTPLLTDDNPFLFEISSDVDMPLKLALITFLFLSFIGARNLIFEQARINELQMFCLGISFTLLEIQSANQLAPLLGNTWISTGIVIAVAIVATLCANLLLTIKQLNSEKHESKLLVLTCILVLQSYLLRADDLLRVFALTASLPVCLAVIALPLLSSSILFALLLVKNKDSSRALSANLFGALLAGVFQFSAVFFGYKSLALIALLFYVLCFMLMKFSSSKRS